MSDRTNISVALRGPASYACAPKSIRSTKPRLRLSIPTMKAITGAPIVAGPAIFHRRTAPFMGTTTGRGSEGMSNPYDEKCPICKGDCGGAHPYCPFYGVLEFCEECGIQLGTGCPEPETKPCRHYTKPQARLEDQ